MTFAKISYFILKLSGLLCRIDNVIHYIYACEIKFIDTGG
jgi:hypothetical protein